MMAHQLPQRPKSHQLERASQKFFEACLPVEWLTDKPPHDYGVDIRVAVFNSTDATGLEFVAQLKATKKPQGSDTEPLRLNMSTYNYLKNLLHIVMFVKFVESENEAYWMLLRDVPTPDHEQKTMTVRIPRKNSLSKTNWGDFQRFLEEIADRKLAKVRAGDQRKRARNRNR
jgi:uncharacterized protein DUF4365